MGCRSWLQAARCWSMQARKGERCQQLTDQPGLPLLLLQLQLAGRQCGCWAGQQLLPQAAHSSRQLWRPRRNLPAGQRPAGFYKDNRGSGSGGMAQAVDSI